MDNAQVISLFVDGIPHEARFIVTTGHVIVHTDAGERSAPVRNFEPEELARLVAVDLLRKEAPSAD